MIIWYHPRKDFHRYLERLVDAGFEDRIMFGTDFVVWPDAIDISVQSVTAADFLTKVQVKKILYDNASRFLRLTEEEMKAHHSW